MAEVTCKVVEIEAVEDDVVKVTLHGPNVMEFARSLGEFMFPRRDTRVSIGLVDGACSCAAIQAADPLRHFSGCPLREPLPDGHPMAGRCGK